MSRPARLIVATALALASTLALAAPAGAAPRTFFGMQAWSVPTAAQFHTMGQGGVGTFRMNIQWSAVEPRPGVRNWGLYDQAFRNAAGAGIEVLPVLLSTPPFLSADSGNPPRTKGARAAYAAFVRDAVSRYGREGTLWRSTRGAHRPARYWQLWNEPNLPSYWGGRPNARQYVSLLKLGRRAIRNADPRAKVVLAALPDSGLAGAVPLRRYLRALYRRRAKRYFDVAAVNPYARDYRGVEGAVIRARRVMRRYRDSRTPIWITEVGWATAGPATRRTRAFRTSRAGQASRLRRTYRRLLRKRRRYRIGRVLWFAFADRPRGRGEHDYWAINTGLFTVDGHEKPGWRAFKSLAR